MQGESPKISKISVAGGTRVTKMNRLCKDKVNDVIASGTKWSEAIYCTNKNKMINGGTCNPPADFNQKTFFTREITLRKFVLHSLIYK